MARKVAVRAEDLKVLRTGLLSTAVVLAATVAGAWLVVDGAAAGGAALGVLLAAAFFSASMLVVNAVAKTSPALMFPTAMGVYVVKIFGLLALIAVLRRVDWWPPAVFGLSVLAATLVWLGAEVRLVMLSRVLYVTPEER